MPKEKLDTKLTPWEDDVCATVRALQPGVAINTCEEPRCLLSLRRISAYLDATGLEGRDILHWSACSFRRWKAEQPEKAERLVPMDFGSVLDFFVNYRGEGQPEGKHKPSFLILSDPGPFLNDQNAINVRMLRETLWRIREAGALKAVFLLGAHVPLPEDIAADFYVTEFRLFNFSELHGVFDRVIKQFTNECEELKHLKCEPESLRQFTRGCVGLPEYACRSLLTKAVARFEAIDERAVKLAHDEKEQIVRRSGIAEFLHPRGGLEMVGGLAYLKAYIHEIDGLLAQHEEARKYGCKLPSGIALAGLPGGGKSLLSEALGRHWNLPILRLDMGSMFGSLVGESEARFRQFKGLASALGSVIVAIDEFEKGIGGGGRERDGGTTERVKQAFLTWLQEKPEGVIVVATMNNIQMFDSNPEMLRAGRFDSLWFIDLPDAKSRLEILHIHLKKSGHDMPDEVLKDVLKISFGYTGAELEAAVQTAVRRAFREKLAHPTVKHLLDAVQDQIPLMKTMAPQLQALRQFVKDGRMRPASVLLETADQDTSEPELNGPGLPQLFKKG